MATSTERSWPRLGPHSVLLICAAAGALGVAVSRPAPAAASQPQVVAVDVVTLAYEDEEREKLLEEARKRAELAESLSDVVRAGHETVKRIIDRIER
jgi:hypothetical protein